MGGGLFLMSEVTLYHHTQSFQRERDRETERRPTSGHEKEANRLWQDEARERESASTSSQVLSILSRVAMAKR